MRPHHDHTVKRWVLGASRAEVALVLLVLGILGMVILAFVSLNRERTKETVCSMNVRRLAVAFQNYAAEHSQYPACGKLGDELPQDWLHWQPGRRIEQSALAPWLGEISSRTMACPRDLDTRHRQYQFSYTMNMHLHLAAVAGGKPAATVVVFEEEHPNDGACLPGHPSDRLAHRHTRGRSHAGFGDGSVRLVREHEVVK
ncbi:MAG: DUF1559 domain-containing protein [Verrucomicrobiae bacterium]|nr:DUF1559 domain-containing protein [Verrucomicrobiae bacterium]